MNKLYRKYSNKRVNAAKEGIIFSLSLNEFVDLANRAGITHEQMNINGYHLARYNDSGSYSVDNCRFIPAIENIREKKCSEKSRNASKANIQLVGRKNQTPSAITKKSKSLRLMISNLSKEDRVRVLGELTSEEISRRHEIIKTLKPGFGLLTRASDILGIKPQAVGKFLKKYPIKNNPFV